MYYNKFVLFLQQTLRFMTTSEDFPSLHARIYECGEHICSLYEIGRELSSEDIRHIITRVNAKGYGIEKLEFYEYAPSDSMRHLFVKIKGEKETKPYFMLDKVCWKTIVEELLKDK